MLLYCCNAIHNLNHSIINLMILNHNINYVYFKIFFLMKLAHAVSAHKEKGTTRAANVFHYLHLSVKFQSDVF